MELRLYCFVNFYLSSIQQGIQTGHAAVDLVRKYTASGNPLNSQITAEKREMVENWADNWKTFIVLNGGSAEGIRNASAIIAGCGDFPWAKFSEDYQSLDGLQTCIAVILPESIFACERQLTPQGDEVYTYYDDTSLECKKYCYDAQHPHFELIKLVKSCRLAS